MRTGKNACATLEGSLMLTIQQLAKLKGTNPYLYESLRQIVAAVNALGRATGVDPADSVEPPAPVGGLSVAAADGIVDLAVTDNSAVNRGIFYFAESDISPSFPTPRVHFLGSSCN